MELGLAGRTVLVTGSWRGTGAGIARVLADEGATVLVHGFEEIDQTSTVGCGKFIGSNPAIEGGKAGFGNGTDSIT